MTEKSIYTVEASNKDQALLKDIRKKDMIKNITIIIAFMMLEPSPETNDSFIVL